MQNIIWIYLACVNLALFVIFGIDKKRAVRHRWRIPESTMFFLAAIGGCPGGILGMLVFRHKTMHKGFTIGFPLILAAQIILIVLLFRSAG